MKKKSEIKMKIYIINLALSLMLLNLKATRDQIGQVLVVAQQVEAVIHGPLNMTIRSPRLTLSGPARMLSQLVH